MIRIFFLIFLTFCCSSCIKTIHVSGHLFKEGEIQSLEKAKNKEDVEDLLGSPTVVSDFGQETWYYITTKKETIAFLPDTVIEQNIISITFKNNLVDAVYKYNEKDANKVRLVSEYTSTKGNDISTAQQLFSNVGRFNDNKEPEAVKPRSGF
ncbi:MAG: outer membrane protein assembly factor BamE [Rickettsiales bacterium]|jgi:outer membrane protein assembly factor BamE (lipoprotein component of BamABCDE complex)|nr:outer membrane protein assembly factor BamE [Rickettsiales bacterium]